jgi:sugar transferase EpsL
LKKLFDRSIAGMVLILAAPLLVTIAAAIYLRMGGPVCFVQQRPGLKGKPFRMIKFRTMLLDAGLPENERITALGHFLRATSLDELPELINVLRGEMSLVGPRPLLMEYLPLYTPEQQRRHDVLPGITGYAQINGRNGISWDEKFKLDLWYVEHQSFILDLKIILHTVVKVLRRDGVNQTQQTTMPLFTGTKKDVA